MSEQVKKAEEYLKVKKEQLETNVKYEYKKTYNYHLDKQRKESCKKQKK